MIWLKLYNKCYKLIYTVSKGDHGKWKNISFVYYSDYFLVWPFWWSAIAQVPYETGSISSV